MLDSESAPPHQRSKGRAEVAFGPRPDGAGLDRLHQEGSAKAILPATHGAAPEVVFLNTSGGLTGGDRLDYALTLAPGQRATGTTQTAERAYASSGGVAQVRVRLAVGAGGWLDWLPQETILFDGAALDRETVVDLAPGAGCMMLESVVLGRHAMGETVRGLGFRDSRIVRRDGVPVWVEPLEFETTSLAAAASPAILGGARAFATLAMIGTGAAERLDALRAVLDEPGVEGAASAFEGKCILRLLAWDGLPLRRQIARALAVLRPGPLPRVWQP